MNVFPVERRDECLVEFGQDGMGEFIAFAFNAVNLVDLAFDIPVIREQIHQRAGSGDEIVGHRREHLKEAGILRNEAEHLGATDSKSVCVYSQLQ